MLVRYPSACALILLASPVLLPAQTAVPEDSQASSNRWSLHYQATSIGQTHPGFPSPYEAENSMPGHAESRVSLTSTLFLALRLSPQLEVVVNPEIAAGKGFGSVTGMAGFPNGEIPRVASATPSLYLARAFLRTTLALGPQSELRPAGVNQTAGRLPTRRYTFVAGKFGLTDYFDGNTYSHDPRSQFMNWSIMYNGAWDYPADTRGYTVGTVHELAMDRWSLRAAIATEPTQPNGPTFDLNLTRNRGLAVEYEGRWILQSSPGAIRLLGFQNREHAGSFRKAIQQPGRPELPPTRRDGALKYGAGLNFEQALGRHAGIFGRYGWADGKTEAWAFTQIDRSLSGGGVLRGSLWRRPSDHIGIAFARNQLSGDQRVFLARGGLGFIIGDGALHYAPERILEAYYSFPLNAFTTLTFDYQNATNPAFNQDRGPVHIFTLRIHIER